MQSNDVQTLVQNFTNDLTTLVRRNAVEQIIAQLGGSVAAKAGRKPGRPAGSTNKRKAGKRSPADIAAMGERLHSYIKSKPGLRSDQIAKVFHTDPTSMRPAMQMLLASKKITTKGRQRGTTYHAK